MGRSRIHNFVSFYRLNSKWKSSSKSGVKRNMADRGIKYNFYSLSFSRGHEDEARERNKTECNGKRTSLVLYSCEHKYVLLLLFLLRIRFCLLSCMGFLFMNGLRASSQCLYFANLSFVSFSFFSVSLSMNEFFYILKLNSNSFRVHATRTQAKTVQRIEIQQQKNTTSSTTK